MYTEFPPNADNEGVQQAEARPIVSLTPMIQEIEGSVQILISLLSNLKKSKFNKIKTQTLQEKSAKAEKLRRDIEQILVDHEDEIADTQLKFFSKVTRETNFEIQKLIRFKLEQNKKMTEPTASNVVKFDLKTAIALVQSYDGSAHGLDAFIDSINLLGDLTDGAHTATAIKFIKTRVSGKARAAFPVNPQTFQEITNAIKKACEFTESPESILAKLKAVKNKGDQQKFCEEVETLSQKLSTVYINNKIPAEVAIKMATKAGVDTLINGVPNSEVKIILKANEFDTIQKAIQKINETSTTEKTSQIFNVQSNYQRGRGRRNFRNNYQNNGSSRYYSNQNNDYNQRGNYSHNNNRRGSNRGHYNFRGNFRGNYQNGRNNYNDINQQRNGHSVFYAQENPFIQVAPNHNVEQQNHSPQQNPGHMPQQNFNPTPQQHFLGTVAQASQFSR